MTSKLARSVVFDTDGPVQPSAAGATPLGRGVLIKWSVPVAPQDFTPNDPLDVKGKRTQKYVPMIGRPGQLLRDDRPGYDVDAAGDQEHQAAVRVPAPDPERVEHPDGRARCSA